MILDTLPHWRRYAAVNPRFTGAFRFLETVTPDTPVGRHDIAGDTVYALVQRYRSRPEAALQFEAHRRYIDIQFVMQGREVIQWAPLATTSDVTAPYDATKDVALFAAPAAALPVRMEAGRFLILFPDDAHAPCCVWDGPEEVLKVVVKVAV